MRGVAYVFRRSASALHLGHVGWGFLTHEHHYYCGATEGHGDLPEIRPPHDNGYWAEELVAADLMFGEMRHRGYEDYKVLAVEEARPHDARAAADAIRVGGYSVAGNDCLNHVYTILERYGVPHELLPRPVWIDAAPNRWFERLVGDAHEL